MTSSGDDEGAGSSRALLIARRGEVLLIGVRVIPSAARTELRGVHGDRLKVAVSAPPEGGKANAKLIQALAAWLDVGIRDMRVESGHSGRDKMVAFSGVDERELREKLDRSLRSRDRTKRTSDGS